MPQKITQNEFIEKARKIHGNKYDYSKIQYINNYTKVCIVCPKHGEFWQRPKDHLSGKKCLKCSIEQNTISKSLTTEEFIQKARAVHCNKYDYSKVNYVNNHTKVCIICPEHGEFWQIPHSHLNENGCLLCGNNAKLTTEEFIQKARAVHGNKYDYSKVKYINSNEKVCIICPEHGEFWQTAHSHLNGRGCSKCVRPSYDTQSFILEAQKIHGNKYDYSKVEYINTKTKVCIVCPKHGEFWMSPNVHLQNSGCPLCKKKQEEKLFLKLCDIFGAENVYTQYTFNWLKLNNHKQYLDFYIPKYNTAIEYQGEQHFYYKSIYHKNKKGFEKQQLRDINKLNLCKINGVKILYYTFDTRFKDKTFLEETIYTDIEKLKDKIYETKSIY